MLHRGLGLAAGVLALLLPALGARPAQAVPVVGPVSIIDPDWILVNPRDPSMLFAGEKGQMDRSTDAGTTWTQVMGDLGVDLWGCSMQLDGPAVISSDGAHLVVIADAGCPPNGRGDYSSLFMSPNAGTTVDSGGIEGGPEGNLDPSLPVMSPAAPRRVYVLTLDGNDAEDVWSSNDGGHSWSGGPNAFVPDSMVPSDEIVDSITADPLVERTVYANMAVYDSNSMLRPTGVLRSDDAGQTWTTVMTPTVTPALQSFAVSTNPLLPGTLIGQSWDRGVAADVRYYSLDSGHTWMIGTCPGDISGSCPAITIGAAFGAGASYAVTAKGIYSFTGRGPAGARLAISDRLPVPAASITGMQAGPHPGDPIFLLAAGQVYRSTDAGQSWDLLTVLQGPPPNLLPPSTTPGSLLVPQTHHAVGRAFVGAYKQWGLAFTGYPVTEAYLEHGTLYQDFQRVRLQLGGLGTVKIAPLGRELFTIYAQRPTSTGAAYRRAGAAVPSIPTTATQRYFATTHHTLREPFLDYWQQNGGLARLGDPISEMFRTANGDGSGRTYLVQNFTNARLEFHPEIHNTRYAILLGLLGGESLVVRGWQAGPGIGSKH